MEELKDEAPIPSFPRSGEYIPAEDLVMTEVVPAPVDTEIPWGIARVNASAAWPKTMGEGVKVAVIDTGIDAGHPDLNGQVEGGVSFVSGSWMDDHFHGTHVAGTIAAIRDGKGVAGVAPKARLYAVKTLDKNGGGMITSIIKGILWTAENKMDVANMSLGSPIPLFPIHWAIQYAKSKGVTFVAAAGNSGGAVGYPAAWKEVIAVSAMDKTDTITKFSCRGKQIAVMAPGAGVLSTIPGGKYNSFNGTSMASPHVAGLAALAIANGIKGPDNVRAALIKAAVPVPNHTKQEQGSGVIDAKILVGN